MKQTKQEENHAKEQAKAQLQSVRHLVAAFETAAANYARQFCYGEG